MKYWLHRISNEMNVSYPLLEKGYLSIGFSDLCDSSFISEIYNKSINDAWALLEGKVNIVYGSLLKSRYSLWRFLKEMKKGDIVIVPSWGTFSVYELLDDYAIPITSPDINLPEKDWSGVKILRDADNMLQLEGANTYFDIGFLRKVKLLYKDISRADYADVAFTSRMKIRCTNADISDLAENITNAIDKFNREKPINLKADLVEHTVELWVDIIKKIVKPDNYERLVKWYFKKIGASDVYIPPKYEKDKIGDADVIATFENIKTIISVQVKKYDGETSDWAVQQIKDFADSGKGTHDEYNSQFWVVSSSERYSENAIRVAYENNIRLINGIDFVKMLIDAGLDSLEISNNN